MKPKIGSPLEVFTRNMFTHVIQGLSAFLSENAFTISEIAALHIIDQAQGLSVNSIAQKLNLSKSATSRLLTGLEERGLLKRTQNPKDSRAVLLYTSSQGKHLLDEISLHRVQAAEEVISQMPASAARKLLTVINKLKRRGTQ